MPPLTTRQFSAENSAQLVAERLGSGGPLPRTLAAVVAHLHAAVRETRPSVAEWRSAIAFLTEVGHASDEKRQEWVLLSDLLGVTALVEEINSRRPKGATPNTPRGPFYRPDAPRVALGGTISLDGVGEALEVRGSVQDLDGRPVAGARIETWQANGLGQFENQQPDLQPEFNLRGILTADAEGRFHYRTVKPAGYGVPEDGPVGQLLGRMGYPLRRPAHVHFMISAPGFETITTQVFDRCDPQIDSDAIFAVREDLIGDFRKVGDGTWELEFAFVMARSRAP